MRFLWPWLLGTSSRPHTCILVTATHPLLRRNLSIPEVLPICARLPSLPGRLKFALERHTGMFHTFSDTAKANLAALISRAQAITVTGILILLMIVVVADPGEVICGAALSRFRVAVQQNCRHRVDTTGPPRWRNDKSQRGRYRKNTPFACRPGLHTPIQPR